jgi:hypothetical protein
MSSITQSHQISASPLLVGFHLLVHGGALLAVMLSSLAHFASALIAVVIALSAYFNVRDQALRRSASAIIAIRLDENGHCQLWQRNKVCLQGLKLTGGCNVLWVLCMNLRSPRGKTYHLNIAEDAMPSEALRSLRMRFEHALVHGDAPQ